MTSQHSRLRWQCRRGMRELDVLLTRYLMDVYPRATDAEKSAFEALLQLSDPELVGYLLKGERSPDPAIESILAQLRGPD
jgi:antitoxin CptB